MKPTKLIARHQPEARHEFLRFQFGLMQLRPQTSPVYDAAGEKVIDERPCDHLCEVFTVLGYGSTEEEARNMAVRKLNAK